MARTFASVYTHDEHHRKVSFREEFVALVKRHGIAFDERYI